MDQERMMGNYWEDPDYIPPQEGLDVEWPRIVIHHPIAGYAGYHAGAGRVRQPTPMGAVFESRRTGSLTVKEVDPGGLAAQAGLKVGDTILRINDIELDGTPQMLLEQMVRQRRTEDGDLILDIQRFLQRSTDRMMFRRHTPPRDLRNNDFIPPGQVPVPYQPRTRMDGVVVGDLSDYEDACRGSDVEDNDESDSDSDSDVEPYVPPPVPSFRM